MTNDLRQYRLAERDFAFGSGMLTMLQEVLDAESEEALLRKLDKSGNGLIETTELPENWSELPRTGNRAALESYSVEQLLVGKHQWSSRSARQISASDVTKSGSDSGGI
jgi:hypothetical protein